MQAYECACEVHTPGAVYIAGQQLFSIADMHRQSFVVIRCDPELVPRGPILLMASFRPQPLQFLAFSPPTSLCCWVCTDQIQNA